MKIIVINSETHGSHNVLLDDEDYEKLKSFRWRVLKDGNTYYAVRSYKIGIKNWKSIKMHREIMGVTDRKELIDHKDHNGLNNQKLNLRKCTPLDNSRNRSSYKNSHSKYLGVHPTIRKEPFWARYYVKVCVKGVHFRLGSFPYTPEGEIEAAKKHDEFVKEHIGEFAELNFK